VKKKRQGNEAIQLLRQTAVMGSFYSNKRCEV